MWGFQTPTAIEITSISIISNFISVTACYNKKVRLSWSLAFIEMSPCRSIATALRRRALVIARHRKSWSLVLEEAADKHPVENVMEHIPLDVGESDALQSCGLQKRLELLALPDGPVSVIMVSWSCVKRPSSIRLFLQGNIIALSSFAWRYEYFLFRIASIDFSRIYWTDGDGILEVAGTWMPRSHKSNSNEGFVIDCKCETGFFLDFEVVSNFCGLYQAAK